MPKSTKIHKRIDSDYSLDYFFIDASSDYGQDTTITPEELADYLRVKKEWEKWQKRLQKRYNKMPIPDRQ